MEECSVKNMICDYLDLKNINSWITTSKKNYDVIINNKLIWLNKYEEIFKNNTQKDNIKKTHKIDYLFIKMILQEINISIKINWQINIRCEYGLNGMMADGKLLKNEIENGKILLKGEIKECSINPPVTIDIWGNLFNFTRKNIWIPPFETKKKSLAIIMEFPVCKFEKQLILEQPGIMVEIMTNPHQIRNPNFVYPENEKRSEASFLFSAQRNQAEPDLLIPERIINHKVSFAGMHKNVTDYIIEATMDKKFIEAIIINQLNPEQLKNIIDTKRTIS